MVALLSRRGGLSRVKPIGALIGLVDLSARWGQETFKDELTDPDKAL